MKHFYCILLLLTLPDLFQAHKTSQQALEITDDQLLFVPLQTTFTYGLPYWAEIMIGFTLATPVQGLKLFFPFPCIRNILQVLVESFDFYVFYQIILSGEDVKGMIFASQSMFSMISEFPQIIATCMPTQPTTNFSETLSIFTDSVMYLVKFVVYLDTGMNFFLDQEWILGGFYGMTTLLNIVSFIAFYAFNSS